MAQQSHFPNFAQYLFCEIPIALIRPKYACDVCGAQTNDLKSFLNHIRIPTWPKEAQQGLSTNLTVFVRDFEVRHLLFLEQDLFASFKSAATAKGLRVRCELVKNF
jgi:hypothetical protein